MTDDEAKAAEATCTLLRNHKEARAIVESAADYLAPAMADDPGVAAMKEGLAASIERALCAAGVPVEVKATVDAARELLGQADNVVALQPNLETHLLGRGRLRAALRAADHPKV